MNLSNSILSDITVYSKYAKHIESLKRRETWEELITRNMEMHIRRYPQLEQEIRDVYKDFVLPKKVLPSMRSLQFAGKPIEINNSRVYNCAFLPIDHIDSFSEAIFLLLGGTGVGYSVQRHHIDKLPEIQKPSPNKVKRYLVGDSIEGWADSIKMLMKSYFGRNNATIKFDFSDIRAKGAKLITSGGKAPGPEPLANCIARIKKILDRKENGDKLTPIEVHDIVCHLADAVLAGGIRRAALISLFNADDEQMIKCKSSSVPSRVIDKRHATYIDGEGVKVNQNKMYLTIEQNGVVYTDVEMYKDEKYGWTDLQQYEADGTFGWWVCNGQRGRANNSVVLLRNKIKKDYFLSLWKQVEDSNAGEPGFFLTNDKDWGTNPCCEIALRPYQFCNLCEINASNIESQEDLNARARAGAFIGTLQAGYTDFHYLRDIWKRTTEKDALIGVGMTGIADGSVLNYNLTEAAEAVLAENERVASIIGINKSARSTTVKPSGTSSMVLGTASGIHARHNDYYIRRMRVGKNESLYRYMAKYHPELIEDCVSRPLDTAIISIPQEAPKGSILRTESALETLERVKRVTAEWVRPGHRSGQNTHNVSCTISLKQEKLYEEVINDKGEKQYVPKKDENGNFVYSVNEWPAVGEWMWKNRDYYTGISVLPYFGGSYRQAPFEDITKEEYDRLSKTLTGLDLRFATEETDETNLAGELACAGGNCEIPM